VVTKENGNDTILINEVSKSNLNLLRITVEDVFLPLFSKKENLKNWSKKSRYDVIDKLASFCVETKVIVGQIKGKTELPLPTQQYLNSIEDDKDKKIIFELNITMWKKLVKKVLKQDRESIFKTEDNPGPMNEIDFWYKRGMNLK
jgi:dynein heavy chain